MKLVPPPLEHDLTKPVTLPPCLAPLTPPCQRFLLSSRMQSIDGMRLFARRTSQLLESKPKNALNGSGRWGGQVTSLKPLRLRPVGVSVVSP